MNLLLKSLSWLQGDQLVQGDVRIRDGLIAEIQETLASRAGETTILFKNHYLYPGLINAHDHLEMNLYPRLGHPPYKNYTDWSKDIYKPMESPVREIEKINIRDRLLWGGIKNLISGATTVVHHNPWNGIFDSKLFPVRVAKNIAWSHSIVFGKDIQNNFHQSAHLPFTIHAAEGVDGLAENEIETLNHLGMLAKNTVLIHAVALRPGDIDRIRINKCSVVWCPASNIFLFDRTAPIDKLKECVPIALGSDSTLTGSPTLLDEIHCAQQTGFANAKEIYNMITVAPARIFGLPHPSVSVGSPADLMVTPRAHPDYFENLQNTRPEDIQAVMVKGEVKLLDESIAESSVLQHAFKVNGVRKHSNLDVTSLIKRLRKQTGEIILQRNPLWQMLAN